MSGWIGSLVLANIVVVCVLVWGPRDGWTSSHRAPVTTTVPLKRAHVDSSKKTSLHKGVEPQDEALPALREARPIFIPEAYREAVDFFRPGGRGETFRIYIEDSCWVPPDHDTERPKGHAAPNGRQFLASVVGDPARIADMAVAYGVSKRHVNWFDGWAIDPHNGPHGTTERDQAARYPCYNNYALAPFDKFRPRQSMAEIWHQKFATEAYIPTLVALSRWAGGRAPTRKHQANPFRTRNTATLVVKWANCVDSAWMARDACRATLAKAGADERALWYIETHDWAECWWELDQISRTHTRDCGTWGRAAHKLQNFGVVPEAPDRANFSVLHDVVLPTSNGFVSPTVPAAGPAVIALSHKMEELARLAGGVRATRDRRKLLGAFLVGKTTPERKAVAGIRDPEIRIVDRASPPDAMELYATSRYCLQADGAAPWSPRLVEYILLGCVPVFVSDTIVPPFATVLDWEKFSLWIPPRDIPKLPQLLRQANHSALFEGVVLASPWFQWHLSLGKTREGWGSALPLVVFEMYRRSPNGPLA